MVSYIGGGPFFPPFQISSRFDAIPRCPSGAPQIQSRPDCDVINMKNIYGIPIINFLSYRFRILIERFQFWVPLISIVEYFLKKTLFSQKKNLLFSLIVVKVLFLTPFHISCSFDTINRFFERHISNFALILMLFCLDYFFLVSR